MPPSVRLCLERLKIVKIRTRKEVQESPGGVKVYVIRIVHPGHQKRLRELKLVKFVKCTDLYSELVFGCGHMSFLVRHALVFLIKRTFLKLMIEIESL